MSEKILDISQTLRPGLPVWPGDTSFQADATWTLGSDCPVNVSRLTLSTHSGSHADAPCHYDAEGAAIDAVALAPYLGPCVVIEALSGQGAVEWDEIADQLPENFARVLIRTYPAFPRDEWDEVFRPIAPDLIAAVAARGAVLIGVDTPSLDPQSSKTMDAHMAVKAHGLAILEGLVLDNVPPGAYELIALPLAIAGADASPVRAVLRSL